MKMTDNYHKSFNEISVQMKQNINEPTMNGHGNSL